MLIKTVFGPRTSVLYVLPVCVLVTYTSSAKQPCWLVDCDQVCTDLGGLDVRLVADINR
jgi:hypothetical protein